ncbi:Transposable element P transposase, partial [Aphis craccivora]
LIKIQLKKRCAKKFLVDDKYVKQIKFKTLAITYGVKKCKQEGFENTGILSQPKKIESHALVIVLPTIYFYTEIEIKDNNLELLIKSCFVIKERNIIVCKFTLLKRIEDNPYTTSYDTTLFDLLHFLKA